MVRENPENIEKGIISGERGEEFGESNIIDFLAECFKREKEGKNGEEERYFFWQYKYLSPQMREKIRKAILSFDNSESGRKKIEDHLNKYDEEARKEWEDYINKLKGMSEQCRKEEKNYCQEVWEEIEIKKRAYNLLIDTKRKMQNLSERLAPGGTLVADIISVKDSQKPLNEIQKAILDFFPDGRIDLSNERKIREIKKQIIASIIKINFQKSALMEVEGEKKQSPKT